MEKQSQSSLSPSVHAVAAVNNAPDAMKTPSSPGAQVETIEDEKTSAVAPGEGEQDHVSGIKLLIVMASITLVTFLVMIDMSIVATAVPRITTDFHSLSDVGWYGSAYLLASCSLQPLTGKIYTYFHSKSTFLTFFALFELGSLLCGVAVSSKMLIVGRAVAGSGTAGLMNGALTIICACIPLAKRPLYIGVLMSVSQIGIVLGPLLGGILTQYTTWRWCFYINLPIGAAVAILLFLIRIPDITVKIPANNSDINATTVQNPSLFTILSKLDLLGFTLFAPAAVQFLLALEWGGHQYSWSSPTVIGLFCGAGVTFAIFIAWEYRMGDGAMIPLTMARQTIVASSCLVSFFLYGGMLTFSYYLPIYFQAVRGVSPTLSGVYTLPVILSQMVGALGSGYLVSKYGYYILSSGFSGVLTAVGFGLASTYTPNTSTGVWIGYQIIIGLGRGCGIQMPLIAMQNFLPKETLSVGTSLAIFSQTFGGTLFLSFAETIFTNSLVQALAKYAPSVNPQTIITAGASAVNEVVSSEELPAVLMAYNQAVVHTFWLAAGAAVASFIFCWGMGWKGVKKPMIAESEDTVD